MLVFEKESGLPNTSLWRSRRPAGGVENHADNNVFPDPLLNPIAWVNFPPNSFPLEIPVALKRIRWSTENRRYFFLAHALLNKLEALLIDPMRRHREPNRQASHEGNDDQNAEVQKQQLLLGH